MSLKINVKIYMKKFRLIQIMNTLTRIKNALKKLLNFIRIQKLFWKKNSNINLKIFLNNSLLKVSKHSKILFLSELNNLKTFWMNLIMIFIKNKSIKLQVIYFIFIQAQNCKKMRFRIYNNFKWWHWQNISLKLLIKIGKKIKFWNSKMKKFACSKIKSLIWLHNSI